MEIHSFICERPILKKVPKWGIWWSFNTYLLTFQTVEIRFSPYIAEVWDTDKEHQRLFLLIMLNQIVLLQVKSQSVMESTYQYNLHSQINFWKQMVLHTQSYFYQTNKPYSYHSLSKKERKNFLKHPWKS